jgi:hypothetical protein
MITKQRRVAQSESRSKREQLQRTFHRYLEAQTAGRHSLACYVSSLAPALGARLFPIQRSYLETPREEDAMHIRKNDIPVRIDVPGAIARQKKDFGDATGFGKFAGEYFSLGAGTDIAPLLKGLEGDLCQSPHWGYLLEGEVVVTYEDGRSETVVGGDLFYWPPGHTVKVDRDAELVLFSPQHEHVTVVDHLARQLAG